MRIADRHIDDAGRERQASAASARPGDRKMFNPEVVPHSEADDDATHNLCPRAPVRLLPGYPGQGATAPGT